MSLRNAGVCVVSGFHSAIEYDALPILLRGDQPVILFHDQRVSLRTRLVSLNRAHIESGRYLVLTAFQHRSRTDRAQSSKRNMYVAAMADALFVVHAAENSATYSVVSQALDWGTPVYALDDPSNEQLFAVGVESLKANNAGRAMARITGRER